MFGTPYSLEALDTRSANQGPIPGPPDNISPLRREHVPRPPPLTTALNPLSFHGHIATPYSTTSLSSPFSQSHLAYQVTTPSSAARAVSPMSSRFAGYNAPYNPQEWASQNAGPIHTELGHNRPAQRPQAVDPEAPVASPPPPYSPKPDEGGFITSPSSTLSPAESSRHSSHTTTPTSAYVAVLPYPSSSSQFQQPRRPAAVLNASSPSSFPPPPPLKSNSRPSSRLGNLITGVTNRRNAAFSPAQSISPGSIHNQPVAQYDPASGPVGGVMPMPPSARRAASVGVTSIASSSSRTASHTDSRSPSAERHWDPARPLPGPPPGPPPAASRSQSVSGVGDVAARGLLAPAPRPKIRQAPPLGTTLDPVPPTPADWVDDGSSHNMHRGIGNLHVDTAGLTGSNVPLSDSVTESVQSQFNSGGNLNRSSAIRDTSAKGLRERRTVTRSNRSSMADMSALSINSNNSNNPWLTSVKSSPRTLHDPRRLDTAETTPDAAIDEEYRKVINLSPADSEHTTSSGTQQSTPKAAESAKFNVPAAYVSQTPPWSAGAEPSSPTIESNSQTFMPNRSLPTPPPGQYRRPSVQITRPISHILHSPNDATSILPLSPLNEGKARVPIRNSSETLDLTDDEAFMAECGIRHDAFLRAEKAASRESDRLQLFADFILEESRIRRDRYASAWASGGFDVRKVRDRLFEQPPQAQRRASGVLRLVTASPDSAEPPTDRGVRPEHAYASGYHPALSPIASMSNEEVSSRGRAPSRWWESPPGSNSDGQRRALERSKRESKYMGMSRAAREAIQKEVSQPTSQDIAPEYSGQMSDYPDEKQNPSTFGYYDKDPSPAYHGSPMALNSPMQIDVSRFITLPPPYPRHHPAVNNSHPDLTTYRTAVRNMSELDDVALRKSRLQHSVSALRTEHRRKLSDNRRNFKSEIQNQVQEGSITYGEAAEAEQALKLEEHEAEKKAIKQEYDEFTDVMLNPLHNMLNGRIEQLDGLITGLQHKLVTDAQSPNPDQTQEAGDEEPELLEKLTQLKWLFETREQIHREIFSLLTQRNETYKEIVLLPYRQTNNIEKLTSTEAFFAHDNRDRCATFENEALKRYENFYAIIEDSVTRGVEMQSSAFWDIAPGLEDLLQKIPERLDDFGGIQIPDTEMAENQAYREHPLQYLYSLLLHAEKSTYQFIEAQTNLHCLLHEVKGGVVTARFRALGSDDLHANQRKALEEEELTRELQQKVSMIENIWTEALGSRIQGTRERVRHYLEREGGWTEELEQSDS